MRVSIVPIVVGHGFVTVTVSIIKARGVKSCAKRSSGITLNRWWCASLPVKEYRLFIFKLSLYASHASKRAHLTLTVTDSRFRLVGQNQRAGAVTAKQARRFPDPDTSLNRRSTDPIYQRINSTCLQQGGFLGIAHAAHMGFLKQLVRPHQKKYCAMWVTVEWGYLLVTSQLTSHQGARLFTTITLTAERRRRGITGVDRKRE
jgi:hypothetical protein